MSETPDLFESVIEFPDVRARLRYNALVGIDALKSRLTKESQLLLQPARLEEWSQHFHGGIVAACNAFVDRHSVFVFAGDVGTGKTALAETFGDEISRSLELPVFLYRLSLASRGSGAVGEMTQLLASAFEEVRRAVRGSRAKDGRYSSSAILLIDEADALAQSREALQMHHEDRAGVNALIRGINSLSDDQLPILVVLATNRLGAIDPAIRRRAAAIFDFQRPDADLRRLALARLLNGIEVTESELDGLVAATGSTNSRSYGYTYSDLYQRLIPAAVLAAYPDKPLTYEILVEMASSVEPSPPFAEEVNK
jgi:SpoVK/Ycf46/Vps4 family AAA+-type ATPase